MREKGSKTFKDKKEQYTFFQSSNLEGESKVAKLVGEKTPFQVKCWDCGGDHYARECP